MDLEGNSINNNNQILNNSLLSDDSILNSSIDESDENYENESEVLKYYSSKVINIEGSSNKLRKTLIMENNDRDNPNFSIDNFHNNLKYKRRDAFAFSYAKDNYLKSPRHIHSKSLLNVNEKNFRLNDKNEKDKSISDTLLDNENENEEDNSDLNFNNNNNKSLFTNLTEFQQLEIMDFLQEITSELDNMFKILNKYVESNTQKSKKIKILKTKILNIYEKYNTLKLDYTFKIDEKNKVLTVYEEVIDCLDKEKNQLNEKILEMEKNFNSFNFGENFNKNLANGKLQENKKFEGKRIFLI